MKATNTANTANTANAAKPAKPQPPAPQPERPADPLRESIAYAARMKPGAPRGERPHLDVVRFALVRHVSTFMELPRRCGEPQCRRSRRCVGVPLRCPRDVAERPMTAEEGNKSMAQFRQLLTRMLQKRGE